MSLNRGLELIRAGKYFEAHEELEDEWHGAPESERDFLQGLVHVAVAWHHAGLANRPGCERQLDKAAMRLKQYRPHHRGVDVSTLLTDVRNAQWIVESGSLSLPKPRLVGPALKTPVLGQAARRSG
jgi:predicted metal-dependent hydrolase